jgi:hypothetical protein
MDKVLIPVFGVIIALEGRNPGDPFIPGKL